MNDLELQRWLASQLPELIETHSTGPDECTFIWAGEDNGNGEAAQVTDREWDRVVRMVEAKLRTATQQNKYQAAAAEICWEDHDRSDNQVVFNQLTATWQQRTRALMEVLK